jgi:hypothetical protein
LESCRPEQLQQSKQIQTAKKDHAERLAAAWSENSQLLKQLDIQGKKISNQKLQIISLQDIAETEKARANTFCTLVGEQQGSNTMYVDQLDAAAHGQPAPRTVNVDKCRRQLRLLLVAYPASCRPFKCHVIIQNSYQDLVFQTLQSYLERGQLIARVQVGTGMTRRCSLALSPGLETKISTASNLSW